MELVNIRIPHIYIITDPDRRNKMQHDLYKLGIWSGTYKGLINRYITYFPPSGQVKILIFKPTEHARHIERLIKTNFSPLADNRQININGRHSEWFKGSINLIIPFIFSKINEINRPLPIGTFEP